jgi:hypothetical protein
MTMSLLTSGSGRRVFAAISVAGLLTFAVAGCGGGPSSGSNGGSSGGGVPGEAGNPLGVALPDNVTNGTANVTLASNTVKIARSTVASELTNVSNFGSTYTFSSTGGGVGSLKAGSIMFLEGTAIRTVTSVTPQGGGVVINTSDASLEDAFSSANISFNQHVSGSSVGTIETGAMPSGSYSEVPTPTPSPAASSSHDSVPAGTSVLDMSDLISTPRRLTAAGFSATTTIAGWSVTMTVAPSSNRLDFDVEATKGSDPQVTLSGKGYVSDFIAASDIDIASGQLVHGGFSAQNLSGQITFTWKAVAQVVKLSKNLIKLPLNYTIPIVVGGIPFSIGIGCEFLATIGFTSKDTVVGGDTTVNFGPGSEGFTLTKSAGMTVAGLMSGIGQILQSVVPTVTVGPLGIVLAIELPRISLGVGVVGTQAGAYVDVVSSTGVTDAGVLGLIPCHDVKLDVTGGAGVSASIFGISFNNLPKTTLFTKTYDLSNPPGCLGQ